MQKNLSTRLALKEKSYILSISTKVLDGRIFLTGKVDEPEEKIQITKIWVFSKNLGKKSPIWILEEILDA